MDNGMPQISLPDLVKDEAIVIDVRSPSEFAEFHLPGSVNIPLFDDEERKMIGTMYKQVSPEEAKREGMRIFSQKLPTFYEQWLEIHDGARDKDIVVTCARGGMRSGSFVSMMSALDLPAKKLIGGMRSVRSYIREELDRFAQTPMQAIVLGGNTGTRKTVWLHELEREGYPVLDLEGLAGHRGSVFGHIGLEQRSQKEFEFLLVQALQRLENKEYVLIEAESKRIGKVVLPEWLQDVKENGVFIEIDDRIERRVSYLVEEYQPEVHHDSVAEALSKITKRLADDVKQEAQHALEQKDYATLTRILLEDYYDPMYTYKQHRYVDMEKKKDLSFVAHKEEEILPALKKEIDEAYHAFIKG
ncbi:tRNA 2-selenouridine(34) synthase MnmH [Paenalkalicoccus suaedae]|uniref:tRNA 2-selenouridine(34) synthase MnmH n=1 Tax=Paenalkalicoccus suaedae TaxID=2592382 RepID=UPI00158A4B32|nr:tRNA 2-selenouridine(34) synthase MnmH [Paenalkalicoccus suaedae]